MSLDHLEGLFDLCELSIDLPTSDQLFKMYGIFLDDFVKNKTMIHSKVLTVNTSKSSHRDFKGKAETFVHIITRKNQITGRREYDRTRANRIHWIRLILANTNDNRIFYFEKVSEKGQNQFYYWYKDQNFIVILREINPSLLLVTSYCVDSSMVKMYNSWLRKYYDSLK